MDFEVATMRNELQHPSKPAASVPGMTKGGRVRKKLPIDKHIVL